MDISTLLLVLSLQQPTVAIPVYANCYDTEKILTTVHGSESVNIISSLAGTDTPCYAVKISTGGDPLYGYVTNPELPAIVAFEQARRSASVAANPTPPTAPIQALEKVPTQPIAVFDDFSGTDASGHFLQLSRVKAKAILVTFWSPRNNASLKGLKALAPLYEELNLRGLQAIGISLENDNARILGILDETPVNWPQIGDRFGLAVRYHVKSGSATTFVLDRDRRIVASGVSGPELEKVVRGLITAP